jgi:outer membrane biogenesis lipoprotein LolB
MVKTELQEQQWREYTGDMLGLIASALASMGGTEAKLPLYSEIAHPEKKKSDVQEAEEARRHIEEVFGFTFPGRG